MIVSHTPIKQNYDLRLLKIYLFLILASFFILTNGGTIQGTDGPKMYEVTKSIVQRGEFSIPPDFPHISPGLDGKWYTGSGIGQSVIAVPLYVLGSTVSKLINMDEDYMTEFAVSMLNPIVLALICVVFFSLGQKIGYTVKTSFIISLCFGLSTMIFPYTKTFYNHPLTTLFLLLSVYYIVGVKAYDKQRSRLLLSGLFLGLTIIVRYQMMIVIPIFLIYLVFVYFKSDDVWLSVKRYFKGISLFIIPVCLGLFIFGWYNLVRFGSPLEFGGPSVIAIQDNSYSLTYDDIVAKGVPPYQVTLQKHFGHLLNSPFSWLSGFIGLLFSPGKGIFWYNPILFLFPFGFFYLRKNHKLEAFLFLSIILVEILFYSLSSYWHGANAWGPRYIIETLPFFVLVSYYVCRKVSLKRIAITLTIISFFIQFPAVIVSYRAHTFKMLQEYKDLAELEEKLPHSIRHSPIIGQWQIVVDVLTKTNIDKESIRNLANAKFEGEEEDDPSLTLNTPYFWFYYLYLLGFPSLLIIVPIGFLLCLIIFSLFQITKLLKNLDRTRPERCNNSSDSSACHIKPDTK